MQVSTEPLKIGRQQYRICSIDLLRGEATPACIAANGPMCVFNLIEVVQRICLPIVEGY